MHHFAILRADTLGICVFLPSSAPFRNLINWNRAIFSPDDAHVAAGGHLGEIFFWNAESGKLESILPGVSMSEGIYGVPTTGPSTPSNAPSAAPTLTSSSSAAAVAAANTIGEQALSCIDWNRNGKQVMSCDQGGSIHIWENDPSIK
jgi:WD40 repeat protein